MYLQTSCLDVLTKVLSKFEKGLSRCTYKSLVYMYSQKFCLDVLTKVLSRCTYKSLFQNELTKVLSRCTHNSLVQVMYLDTKVLSRCTYTNLVQIYSQMSCLDVLTKVLSICTYKSFFYMYLQQSFLDVLNSTTCLDVLVSSKSCKILVQMYSQKSCLD